MNRLYSSFFLFILLLPISLLACADGNPEAPLAGKVHTTAFVADHGVEATADLDNCKSCHKSDLSGGQNAGSCLECHPNGITIAHAIPYDTPELHGAAAKANLVACQVCHGTPQSTSFDGGTTAVACSTCHEDAGAHPTRWQGSNDNTSSYLSTHRNAGSQSASCGICHEVTQGNPGPNPNAPSCFSPSFTNADSSTATACHSSGPSKNHSPNYDDPLNHGQDAKADLTVCVSCHATPANAGVGDNPRFNVALGDLAAGCEDCHVTGTAHPTSLWTGAAVYSHKNAGNMDTACALCHGTLLNGPAGGGTAPACTDCHTAGSPLTNTNCTSCHNLPPDGRSPAGNQSPNRDGAHTVHDALAGISTNCDACHNGAGTESAVHFNGGNPATVSIISGYNAQSGSAAYNNTDKSCSNTRCHGGQTSPNWLSGSLDVNSDCESCHTTSTGQYNSADSGRHRRHVVGVGLACTECHNTSLLSAEHFSNLATTAFEGNPWDTLNSYLNYNHSTRSGCSVSGCHGNEDW